MASSRKRRPTELCDLVAGVLQQHVSTGQRVVVGLSGGVDSVALLHLLWRLQRNPGYALEALHVNHQLSPNAAAWERYCAGLCDTLGIPLSVYRVDVARESGKGLEAAARYARYAAYEKARADWIVLAHQRDDQAETVLLNLLRGAGTRGAAGMPEARHLAISNNHEAHGARLLRPLLNISRQAIVDYARSQALSWIEDESNLDTQLARNFVRAEIMPRLEQRFPQAAASLSRAAAHFSDAETLLETLGDLDLKAASSSRGLRIDMLTALGEARMRNALRVLLRRHGIAPPDTAQLEEIVSQLTYAAADARVSLPLNDWSIRRYQGELFLVRREIPVPDSPVFWNGARQLRWGGTHVIFTRAQGEGISGARLKPDSARLARRQGGEHFKPDAHRPRRTLKKLLQEARVAPWEREIMPLLWCGDDLVWVPAVGIACDYQCHPEQPGWSVSWQR